MDENILYLPSIKVTVDGKSHAPSTRYVGSSFENPSLIVSSREAYQLSWVPMSYYTPNVCFWQHIQLHLVQCHYLFLREHNLHVWSNRQGEVEVPLSTTTITVKKPLMVSAMRYGCSWKKNTAAQYRECGINQLCRAFQTYSMPFFLRHCLNATCPTEVMLCCCSLQPLLQPLPHLENIAKTQKPSIACHVVVRLSSEPNPPRHPLPLPPCGCTTCPPFFWLVAAASLPQMKESASNMFNDYS